MLLRLFIALCLVFHCSAANAGRTEPRAPQTPEPAKKTTELPPDTAQRHISDDDLQNCDVLMLRAKTKEFQEFVTDVKSQADKGDLDNGRTYAAIMLNRFVCHEDEILGEQPWETIIRNSKGKVTHETFRKIIPDIAKHPKAHQALNDLIAAYTRIADNDIDARFVLGRYYLRYNRALKDSRIGYLMIAGAYRALCYSKYDKEDNKSRCERLEREKTRYQKLVAPKTRKQIEKQAETWAWSYLHRDFYSYWADTPLGKFECRADESTDYNQVLLLDGREIYRDKDHLGIIDAEDLSEGLPEGRMKNPCPIFTQNRNGYVVYEYAGVTPIGDGTSVGNEDDVWYGMINFNLDPPAKIDLVAAKEPNDPEYWQPHFTWDEQGFTMRYYGYPFDQMYSQERRPPNPRHRIIRFDFATQKISAVK